MAELHRLRRGDVWDAELPDDIGRRSVALLTRDAAIAHRQRVIVALIWWDVDAACSALPRWSNSKRLHVALAMRG